MVTTDIPLDKLKKAPYIFNGGIFKYKDQNYIAYRANWSLEECKLYIGKMDQNWNPTGANWEVKIPILNNIFEDPRFILINSEPYLAVSQIDVRTNSQYQGLVKLTEKLGFDKYIKINYGDNWSILERQAVTKKPNEHFINFEVPVTFEKNWCFLSDEVNPQFIYKTQPVTLSVELDKDFNLVQESGDAKEFNWPFGEIRGGAPAIKVDGIYYHFFHSSASADPYSQTPERQVGRIYYMGCYTFKFNQGNLELLQQIRIPLEMGDYTQRVELWRNAAVFPCGVVYENNEFKVSYGWGDYKLKILTISKKELHELLTTLQTPVYLQNNLNKKDE